MFNKFKAILLGIVAIAGIILAAFLKGRSSGKDEVLEETKKEQTKAVEEISKQRVENVKVVNSVQEKVIKSSSAAVDKELSDEWTRG